MSHRMSAPSRYIVVGGAGFVGRAVLERWPLAERNSVAVLLRHAAPDWLRALGFATAEGGIDALAARPDLIGPDSAIINLARPEGDGGFVALTRRLIDVAAARNCRRYLHVSSIDVYGNCRETRIDARTVPVPATPYQREHLHAETVALNGLGAGQGVVLRLGAVFGAGGTNARVFTVEAMKATYCRLMLRRVLNGHRRMYLVPVETAADAVRFLAGPDTKPPASHLLLAEDHLPENNFAAVQATLMAVFGRASVDGLPALPPWALRQALRLRRRWSADPMRRFDDQELDRMGFRRHVDFRERLQAYAISLQAERHGAGE